MSMRTLRRLAEERQADAEDEDLRGFILELLRTDREVRATVASLTRAPRPLPSRGGRGG